MATLPQAQALNRVWYEDGVLYAQYYGVITVDLVLELADQCVELIEAHHLKLAPLILMFSQTTDMSHMTLAHIAKVISAPLIRRLSAIIIVGRQYTDKTFIDVASKMFLGDRVKMCDTLTEAQTIATGAQNETQSILEQS